jgi:hypothetical protein
MSKYCHTADTTQHSDSLWENDDILNRRLNLLDIDDDQHTLSFMDDWQGYDVDQDRITIDQDNEIYQIFTKIDLVEHIIKSDLSQLYVQSGKGFVRCLDKKAERLLLDFPVLKDYPDSRWDCEHARIFDDAFQPVSAHYYDTPEHFFKPCSTNMSFLKDGEPVIYTDLVNTLIKAINHDTRYKAALKIRQDKSSEQYRSAVRYVDSIRQSYSRLLVLRLDLCLPRAIKLEVDYQRMKALLNTFLRKLARDCIRKKFISWGISGS